MSRKLVIRSMQISIVIALILTGLSVSIDFGSANDSAAWPNLDFQVIAGGLDYPVHVTHSGDGSGRLFIVEQPGSIRIHTAGGLLPNPFLDISDRVRSPRSGGEAEEGLLSVAFPPGFGATKNHFYVYYTNLAGDNRVSRFLLTSDPDKADPGSEELVLYLDHPTYQNHNGGQLLFGPDGYLYIGTGDGGGGGDPSGNAQNPASLLGKLLRIDVEWQPEPIPPAAHMLYLPLAFQSNNATTPSSYHIPDTNPFVGLKGYKEEIWALGLRNPWRFSFDRSTGDLYIGDVGQNAWEEVDFQPAASPGGENYGWDIMEGKQCYGSPPCDQTGLTLPIFDYPHDDGCSVTGGFSYRGPDYPAMQGIYILGDFCSGKIWGIQETPTGWDVQELTSVAYNLSSFGEDQAGELYLLDRQADIGSLIRVIQSSP